MPSSKTEKQATVLPFQPYHKGFYTAATIDRPLSPKVVCIFYPLPAEQRQLSLKDTLTHEPKPEAPSAAIVIDTCVSAATCWYFVPNSTCLWPLSEILSKPIVQVGIFYHCPSASVAALPLTPTANLQFPARFECIYALLASPLPTSAASCNCI